MFYFLLHPYEASNKANYQQTSILFAEGLTYTNIPFTANIDYYPDISGNYLFKKSRIMPTVQYIVTDRPEAFIPELTSYKDMGLKIIIFDTKDEWVRNTSTAHVKLCYRYFMSTCQINVPLIRPLTFTVSKRLISQVRQSIDWSTRKSSIVWSHRVTNHSVRNYVLNYYKTNNIKVDEYNDNFSIPTNLEELHWWNNTGRRHSIQYYDYLQDHKFIDAHGGYFKKADSICQWDSWKFWEGFICGCVVISADLDYYKIKLPYPLIPYKHYIPIRYDTIDSSYRKLFAMSDNDLALIAKEGQDYVLKYYNPEHMCKYFLESLK